MLGHLEYNVKGCEDRVNFPLFNKELNRMTRNYDPKSSVWVIGHVNSVALLHQHQMAIPIEIGLTAMDINDGILDNYHAFIDPYEIPQGYGINCLQMCEKYDIPYPPLDDHFRNYARIIEEIEFFLDKNLRPNLGCTRKIFCSRSHIREMAFCLNWLYYQINGENKINIFPLGKAMQWLVCVAVENRSTQFPCPASAGGKLGWAKRNPRLNHLETSESESGTDCNESSTDESSSLYVPQKKDAEYLDLDIGNAGVDSNSQSTEESQIAQSTTVSNSRTCSTMSSSTERSLGWTDKHFLESPLPVFYHERQVEEILQKSDLIFSTELGCFYHMKSNGAEHCALAYTNRYAYYLLHILTMVYGVDPVDNCHRPTVRYNPLQELEKRRQLLSSWGPLVTKLKSKSQSESLDKDEA